MSECAEVGMQDFEAGEGLLTQRKLQNSSQNRKIRFEMGIVITTIEVGDLQGRNSRRVEVEVDTGSTYTALPRDIAAGPGSTGPKRPSPHVSQTAAKNRSKQATPTSGWQELNSSPR